MNDSIQANAMHRIPVCCNHNCNEGRACPVRADAIALQQEDGGMSVNFAGDEPMEPWTFAQLLLGGFAVLVLLASLAWAVFINRQVIAYAIGQVFA